MPFGYLGSVEVQLSGSWLLVVVGSKDDGHVNS